jgi:hypothetical protein
MLHFSGKVTDLLLHLDIQMWELEMEMTNDDE